MLIELLFSCRSCRHSASAKTFPVCQKCAESIIRAPALCPRCAGHACVSEPELCFGPQDGLIDSYTAQYLCIEPGYSVLKSWKKHGGPIFDRVVLKAMTAEGFM